MFRLPCAQQPLLHTAAAVFPTPVCAITTFAHGRCDVPTPECATAPFAHGRCDVPTPVCATAPFAHGRCDVPTPMSDTISSCGRFMRDTVTKLQEMDLQSRFTRASLTESTAYGPSVTPDNRFPRIPRSLGAGRGTRLPVFGDSEWSRCLKWDETAGFGRIRVVSVPEEGRDCRYPGNPCGLGA